MTTEVKVKILWLKLNIKCHRSLHQQSSEGYMGFWQAYKVQIIPYHYLMVFMLAISI